MKQPENWASALGLCKYYGDAAQRSLFESFYDSAAAFFAKQGIQPTYLAVDGPGFPEQLRKITRKTRERLSQANGLCGVSVVATPPTSKAPGFDSFAKASLAYLPSKQELLATLSFEERFLPFGSPEYDQLLRWCLELHSWDFGFGFHAPADRDPDYYILEISNGKLSREAEKALNVWYATRPEVRVRRLRDVHPYNIVNSAQLAQPVGDGTLQQFAERNGSLQPLPQDGLFLWRIDESALPAIRAQLADTEAVVHGAAYNLSE